MPSWWYRYGGEQLDTGWWKLGLHLLGAPSPSISGKGECKKTQTPAVTFSRRQMRDLGKEPFSCSGRFCWGAGTKTQQQPHTSWVSGGDGISMDPPTPYVNETRAWIAAMALLGEITG